MTDHQPRQKFLADRDQSDFAERVSRHVGMVRATARRLVDAEAHDVAHPPTRLG